MSPTTARRLFGASTIVGFFGLAVLLLWSDRAIGYLGDVIDFATRLGRKAEAESGINLIDRSDVPGGDDDVVHAIFWGSGMLLIGWMLRRRVPIVLTALWVAGVSIGFELVQPLISDGRTTESTDAFSNLVGVAIGAVLLAIVTAGVRSIWGDDRAYNGDRVHVVDETTSEHVLH